MSAASIWAPAAPPQSRLLCEPSEFVMKIVEHSMITKYPFDRGATSCLRVAQGQTFQIETEDAFTGLIGDRLVPAI
jgi:hypothetical protein